MTATKTKTKARPSTAVSDKQLLKALKDAYAEKGDLPTGIDAEQRKYGLYPKRTYILRFGSWNNAMQKAGLPINPYRRGGQRADGTFTNTRLRSSGPLSMATSSDSPMEDWIGERLARNQAERELLTKLAKVREQEAAIAAELEKLRA